MEESPDRGRLAAALLSALIPGAGQWWLGYRVRGVVLAIPSVVGLTAAALLAERGTIAALEIAVQPGWLWAIVAVNAVAAGIRIAAVVDAWRLGARPATTGVRPLRLSVPALIVLGVLLIPHAIVHGYAVDAIGVLETVFDPEVAPLAEREAELLAGGVREIDLGPVMVEETTTTTGSTSTLAASPTTTVGPITTTTTEPIGPHLTTPMTSPEAALAAALGEDRITILLAGGDFGPGRSDLRTDVMMVATLDLQTGRSALISVSRALTRVPLPAAWSRYNTMQQVQDWHEGREHDELVEEALAAGQEPPERQPMVPCDCFFDRINYLHVLAANWVRTFPDAPDPGMEALRQALEVFLGIPIDYYVLVDFAGFVDLVDAIGGVTVNTTETMDIAFSPAKEGEDPISIEITPGTHLLDGRTALAYVRNRTGSSDTTRMLRQRCMLRDVAAALDPATILTRFPRILAAVRSSTTSTVPLEILPKIIEAVGRLGNGEIATLAITHSTGEVNYMNLPIASAPRARAAVADLLARVSAGEPSGGTSECG